MRKLCTRRDIALPGGLVVSSAVFWLGAWLQRAVAVDPRAASVLWVLCMAIGVFVWIRKPRKSLLWLHAALCCAILAALLFGANAGRDVLLGSDRPKADVAAGLGGIELWFVLCPGLMSVAFGGAVFALARR